MSIDRIENWMIATLDDLNGADAINAVVEAFPEKPAEYRLNHSKGAVLIRYRDSTFDSQGYETANFVVTHLLRNLKKHQDIYGNLDKARQALVGEAPVVGLDVGFFQIRRQAFVGERGGVWQYDQLYALPIYYQLSCP